VSLLVEYSVTAMSRGGREGGRAQFWGRERQVAAKVGQSAGARDWRGARHRCRLALVCALGAGCLAAAALGSLQWPIDRFLHLELEARLAPAECGQRA